MKKLLCLLVLFVSVFTLAGCKRTAGLIDSKYLIVATSPDYAPYEFKDPNKTGQNQYVGADIELAKYIAKELGVELKIEEVAFDACLMAVQTGKVDISISGFSWTPRRAENYALSNSYFGEGDGKQQLLILSNDADKFKTLSDLNKTGIKVGAQSSSLQEELVDSQLPNASKELVIDLSLAVSLLKEGSIDALAISEYAADTIIPNNPTLVKLGEDFDIPTVGNVVVAKKDNAELMISINNIIAKMVEQNLYSQWMEDAKALAIQLGQLQ